jgi:hypothetical protein
MHLGGVVTVEPLHPTATALSAARIVSGGELRTYSVTTANDGWKGLEQFIRQCTVTGILEPSRPDSYAVLDVLDADGSIVQDYGVRDARSWRWIKKRLKFVVEQVQGDIVTGYTEAQVQEAAAAMRSAAAKLRTMAAAATPGPWGEGQETGFQPSVYGNDGQWVAECGPESAIDSHRCRGAQDAAWIALMGTDKGKLIAEILDDAAVEAEKIGPNPRILALAKALGGVAAKDRPTLAETRTGTDWCRFCEVEAGTNRYTEGSSSVEQCALCGARLRRMWKRGDSQPENYSSVQDRYKDLWTYRTDGVWVSQYGWELTWATLLGKFGPLTEFTYEQASQWNV